MSQTIEIHTQSTIDFEKLYDFLQKSDKAVVGSGRSENMVYFYSNGYSTRGIDVSKKNIGYEIRLTTLANTADYKLANDVVLFFKIHVPGSVIIFDDNEVFTVNVFLTNNLNNYFKRDAELVYQLAMQHQTPITLFAAGNEYYLGRYVFSKIHMDEDGWELRLEALIQQVLYKLPKSESDNVLQIGQRDESKIAKLVTAHVSYIIKKYDVLLFNKSKDSNHINDLLFLTNDILNENLPTSWERIDDYTIIAPELGWDVYSEYVNMMIPHHQNNLF